MVRSIELDDQVVDKPIQFDLTKEAAHQQFMLDVAEELKKQPHHRIIDLIDKWQARAQEKLNSFARGERVDFDELASMMHILLMCHYASHRQLSSKMEDLARAQIKVTAKAIKKTYNSWPTLIVQLAGAGLNIASGFGGLWVSASHATATREIFKKAMQPWTSVGTVGSGVGSIGSIFDKRDQGAREILQIELQNLQSKEGAYRTDLQQGSQREEQSMRQLEQLLERINQIKKEILRVS